MADKTKPVNENKQNIKVKVFAPKDPEDIRKFTFNKHEKVGEAAKKAAAKFGYESGNPTFAKDGKVLDRDKQLVDAGVRDGDLLEIVDAGGGV